jgi:hypothetical protein
MMAMYDMPHNSPDGREADARLRMSGILEKPHPS